MHMLTKFRPYPGCSDSDNTVKELSKRGALALDKAKDSEYINDTPGESDFFRRVFAFRPWV